MFTPISCIRGAGPSAGEAAGYESEGETAPRRDFERCTKEALQRAFNDLSAIELLTLDIHLTIQTQTKASQPQNVGLTELLNRRTCPCQ